jgi:hypothetical protein
VTHALFPILGGITYIAVAALITRSRRPTAEEATNGTGSVTSQDNQVEP